MTQTKEQRFEKIVERWDSGDTILLTFLSIAEISSIVFTIMVSPYFVFFVMGFLIAIIGGLIKLGGRKVYWRKIK